MGIFGMKVLQELKRSNANGEENLDDDNEEKTSYNIDDEDNDNTTGDNTNDR